jgi:hypothetical protein
MRLVLSLIAFSFSINAFSFFMDGDSIPKAKRYSLCGFYAGGGIQIVNEINLTNAQLEQLWPEIKKQYYSNYPVNFKGSTYGSGTGSGMFEVGANFVTPVASKSLANKWRTYIGLLFSQSSVANKDFAIYTKKRTDTLFTSASVPYEYHDSIKLERVNLSYMSKYLGFGISETYEHTLNKFISWYAGIGLRALFSYKPVLSEFHTTTTYSNSTTDPNYIYNDDNIGKLNGSKETFSGRWVSAKSSNITQLYFTGGISVRIFRIKKWNNTVFVDPSLNAGVNIVNLQSVGTFSTPFGGFMLRLKYILN